MFNRIQAPFNFLGIFMITVCACAQPVSRPADALTIEETIGTVFWQQMEGRPWNLYAKANPDARQPIYRVLENASLEAYYSAAWHVLGYIGDEATVQRLEERLLSLQGVLSPAQKETVYAMFDSLGLMARRDIKAAKYLADRMAAPTYWQRARFRWVAEAQVANSLSFLEETMAAFSDGYALSQRQDIQGKVSTFVNSLPEGPLKKEMLRRTSIDLLKSVASVVRRGEQRALTQDDRRVVVRLFNGDLENPGPAKQAPRQTSGPSTPEKGFSPRPLPLATSALVKEGFAEYQTFTAAFTKGDYESVWDRILSDGAIRSLSLVKSQWREIKPGFDLEQKLLQLPAVRDAKPVDWTLAQSETYHFQFLTPDGSPSEPNARIETILTFKLDGTKGLFREVVGTGQVNTNTFAPDGSLLVLMKKIDGKWYWNPFGF